MPTTYPVPSDPPPFPDPIDTGDNLDGVTRETLVEAEIAKHKEVLAPDPVVERFAELNAVIGELGQIFASIHADMGKVARHLREIRDAIQNENAKPHNAGSRQGQREDCEPADSHEGVRRGEKEGPSGES